jgi:hypothetical protein
MPQISNPRHARYTTKWTPLNQVDKCNHPQMPRSRRLESGSTAIEGYNASIAYGASYSVQASVMDLGDFEKDWKPETVVRNEGVTADERYLQRLCDRSFLSLWSYAGLFRDQKADGKGDGKELCDLLVVCGDDVLIFSDKGCSFPNTGHISRDWSRWFKSAIEKSVRQAWGAGRWINQHPDRIYLDRACTRKFPIDLPPPERMRIHYIVVAHNISHRCAAYFPGSSGTLVFDSSVIADAHFSSEGVKPFTVGWMDVARPFVHILDDESLDILLCFRDTVTDFVEYLRWKEALLRSAVDRKVTVCYCGEEDLLANYLLNTNAEGHGFALPKEPLDLFYLDEGDWKQFLKSPQRSAQIDADKDSYFWDEVVEKFCRNILDGTSYDRATPFIADREKAVRMLAREPRIRRRILAGHLLDLLRNTPTNYRATRVAVSTRKGDPYYCFLLLPFYASIPIEIYRRARGEHLEAAIRVTKLLYPDALDIVGLATESGIDSAYRSEDVMYLDARNWSPEEQEHARQVQKDFGLLVNPTKRFSKTSEFPVLQRTAHSRRFVVQKNPRNKPCPCGSGKKYKTCHGS